MSRRNRTDTSSIASLSQLRTLHRLKTSIPHDLGSRGSIGAEEGEQKGYLFFCSSILDGVKTDIEAGARSLFSSRPG